MRKSPGFESTSYSRDAFGQYCREVRKKTLLDREEELVVSRRFAETRDPACMRRLVESNLRFVLKIAFEYSCYGLPVPDLVQEGNLGLVRAVERFEPERGYRLISYAVWWIRAAVQDHILRNWSLVKMGTTQRQRRLFNKLLSSRKRLEAVRAAGADWKEHMAMGCGADLSELEEMESRMRLRDCSAEVSSVDGEDSCSILDLQAPDERTAEVIVSARNLAEVRSAALLQGLAHLTGREAEVVRRRHLTEESETLQDLGDHFGISKERVRQLEKRALDKLRVALSGLRDELALAS